MGWHDTFRNGMCAGYRVQTVWESKPSYLVWTCVHTDHSFTDEIMDKVRRYVADRGPGVTPRMAQLFEEKFSSGGPW